jgi:hypothetical protein
MVMAVPDLWRRRASARSEHRRSWRSFRIATLLTGHERPGLLNPEHSQERELRESTVLEYAQQGKIRTIDHGSLIQAHTRRREGVPGPDQGPGT